MQITYFIYLQISLGPKYLPKHSNQLKAENRIKIRFTVQIFHTMNVFSATNSFHRLK